MYHKTETRGNRTYHYLIENIRSDGKWKKIKLYLGSNLTEKEVNNIIVKKRYILKKKVSAYLRASDPLYSLIEEKEKARLEEIRKKYTKYKKTLDSLAEKQYYEWFVTEFTYNTNAIEGSTLSLLDTKLILQEKIVPKDKSLREINEVQNHKDAFDYMMPYKDSLTKKFILTLHKKLMHNILWKQAGVFRDIPVRITGVEKRPPRPSHVPIEFKKLMIWYAHNKKRYHPVAVSSYFHVVFESIHPFRDGNGRVGRLILNFMLKNSGFPMINIKYKDRRKYYESLQSADKGDLKPLVNMIIIYIIESYEQLQL